MSKAQTEANLENDITEMTDNISKNFPKGEAIDATVDTTLSTHFSSEVSELMIKKKSGEGKTQKLKCSMTLFSLCMIVGMSNSAYALIAPFQPLYLKEIGANPALNGYIFR
jgi:hypothetical protein